MTTDIKLVNFQLDSELDKKITDYINNNAQGYELVTSFSPAVTDGNIYVYFVLKKET